jgi:hypothetical protein
LRVKLNVTGFCKNAGGFVTAGPQNDEWDLFINWSCMLKVGLIVVHIDGVRHVSEMRPPAGLLFIPQVIYEHWESWWNDIGKEKLSIRPPEIFGNSTSSNLVAKQEERGEGNAESMYFIFMGFFNMT